MRIVHILPGLTRGGAEELLIHLIQQLSHHEHYVLYVYDGPLKQRLIDAGASLHHIQGKFLSYDFYYWYLLIKQLIVLHPDCIHALLWSSSIAARLIGKILAIPVVCGMHTRKIHDGFVRILAQRCIPFKPFTFIAASKGIARDLIDFHHINYKQITIIENGITIPTQVTKNEKEHLSLLAVGRFIPAKNFSLLLFFFKEIVTLRPRTHLTIVGWGQLEHALRVQAKELKIENHVTFVINQAATPHFHKADIFLQPSVEEGLSIALLEALSYECATIVSGNNHHHDIIQHGINGYVINPKEENVFIQQCIELIDDTNLRKKIAQEGRKLITQRFNIFNVAQSYDSIFTQANLKN